MLYLNTTQINTYIFIDEIYLLFQYEYSANFLFTLWKRVRKYGAFCTGITQNVEDLLQSHTAVFRYVRPLNFLQRTNRLYKVS